SAMLAGLLTDLDADERLREDVTADRAALFGPTLPVKAFARMRLDRAGGDRYVPVSNPLSGACR
ncbi:MAG: hypothetical protein ABR528_12690, partial [Pseudonocardiaceae bacterium]